MTRLTTLFTLFTCALLVNAKNGKGKGRGNNNNNNNAQSSLTLLKNLVQPNSGQTGHNASNPQQADSITSRNNFINICDGKTITNGEQIKTGSCNGIPMGDIPSTDNIPSAKFQFPGNFDTIPANQNFTVKLKTSGFQTGVFTNAETNYYAAPQQLNKQGQIIGHCHVVINEIGSLKSKDLDNPLDFAFFKGIDTPAVNGISEADVTGGLPAGVYRLCSINTSANHTPLLVAVAQHNSMDDCVYFTVSDNGNDSGDDNSGNNNSGENDDSGDNQDNGSSLDDSSNEEDSSNQDDQSNQDDSGNNNGNGGDQRHRHHKNDRRFRRLQKLRMIKKAASTKGNNDC